MTTIAYKHGKMAGDTRAYGFDKMPVGYKQKVFKLTNGSFIGVSASCVGVPKAVRDWVEAGMPQDKLPFDRGSESNSFEAIIIDIMGYAVLLDNSFLPSDPVWHPFYAIGSGKDIAYTAMHLGHSAAEAVKIAGEIDPWTGTEYMVITREENVNEGV